MTQQTNPIEIKQAKISGVKADFTNKEVTITLKVPFSVNKNILEIATNELAFISFGELAVSVDITRLLQGMDF